MVTDFFNSLPVQSAWPGGVAGRWCVPSRIELDAVNDRLLIDEFSKSERWHIQEKASHKLLDDFVGLAADNDGQRILTFARKWGVLDLCVHDLPYWHSDYLESQLFPKSNQPYFHLDDYWPNYLYPPPRPVSVEVSEDCRFPRESLKGMSPASQHRLRVGKKDLPGWEGVQFVAWEPLDAWRTWSRRAGALVLAAQHLHSEVTVPKNIWRDATAIPDGMSHDDWRPPATPEEGWQAISHLLTHWICLAEIRPVVRARGSPQVTMEMPARGLFGAVALQLLFSTARATDLWPCSECGQLYPGRRPNPNRRNYCPDCRDSAGTRNRKRKSRDEARKQAHP